MSDVAFAGQFHPQIVIATATDANPNAQTNLGGVWASSDSGATWTHVVLPGSCSPGPTNAFAAQTGLSRAIGDSSVRAG
jgi:hypothetical protein